MKSRLCRLGIAIAIVVMAFVLFIALSLLSVSHIPSTLRAFVPKADVAEARIITRVISPEIESSLVLHHNHRLITVVGHIQCDQGEKVRIGVNITQDTTGVQAEGHTQNFCTGEIQTWAALVAARGPIRFTLGSAQACAVATTRFREEVTDTFTWCKVVNLVAE